MLERLEHANGVVTYQSPLLRDAGVVHGFSTRIGGVSRGPYATLNLGTLAKGDDSDANTAVAENFRRLRAALGVERMPRAECRQVHSGDVWRVDATLRRPDDAPCADAMVTTTPDRLLVIRTADCVPVLLASRDGAAVAAVHAGWRGVVAGVVPRTVAALRDCGVEPGRVLAAIGPCISVEAFEVGDEVVAAMAAAGLEASVHRRAAWTRAHVDLAGAVSLQLTRAGVEAIDASDCCTFRDAETFFSHRRDAGVSGRMAAVIACRVDR